MADYQVSFDGKITKKKKKKSPAFKAGPDGKIIKATAFPDDIAPVRTWFKKAEGTVGQKILGSGTDLLENIGTGILRMGETTVDALASLSPAVSNVQKINGGQMLTADDWKEHDKQKKQMEKFIKKDLYDEEAVARKIITAPIEKRTGIDAESMSVFGEKSDSLAQSAGQLGATMLLNATGVMPWWATTGLTSFGGEVESALNQGATMGEAQFSGLVSAGAEILTEKISGGIKFGGKTLDDVATKELSRIITNKTLRTLSKVGMDVAGEGGEEILSGYLGAIGKKLTYMDDKKLKEIFSKEEAMESFIGGAILGGVSSGAKSVVETAKGNDYASELSNNEKSVVDRVYKDAVAEMESDGKKLSQKEKRKLYDETLKKLERGYIDTDTIESVLGGETYNKLKSFTDDEAKLQEEYDSMKEEYDTLNKMKIGEMTGEQTDRKAELKNQLEELKEKLKNSSESQMKTEIRSQLDSEMLKIVEGTKLSESYNERARRGQELDVDVESYKNENAKQTAQNFKDFRDSKGYGVNNTNATHDYLDMLTRVAEDRGHIFKFMTTKQLEEAVAKGEYKIEDDASKVEAFVDGKAKEIVINMDANKSLSSLVGHEITHTLESDKTSYDSLQKALFSLAETRGEYAKRWESIQRRYSNLTEEQQKQELTSDLVGDYVFGDSDFIANLSTENPNIFKKIYNEIKYLWKMATAGSKEQRQLETAKKKFEDAWRSANNTSIDSDVKFFVSEKTENVSDRLSNREWNQVKSAVADYTKLNYHYEKSSNGDIIIPVNNKLVYTDANFDSPGIKKVVEFDTEYEDEMDIARGWIYEAEKNKSEISDAYEIIENIVGNEFIFEYIQKSSESAERYDRRTSRGKSKSDSYHSSFLQERIRRANEIIHSVNNEQTSSEDGVFFDAPTKNGNNESGKIQYSFAGENAMIADKSSLENPVEWQEYDAERERLEEKYGEERVWDFQDLKYQMDELKAKGKREASDLYYDTAGEIEARETSRRLTFNENDRKRYQPRNKHENLSRDNVVFADKNNRFRLADDIPTKEYGNHIYSKDVALDVPIKESLMGQEKGLPVTEESLPIRSDYAQLTEADAPVARILTEEPTVEKKKSRFWEQAMELVADKGFVFENLSKKTKNRELEAKWNFIRYSDTKAQDFIGNGAAGVKSLDSIQKEVTQKGITKELYEYLYHQHNIDRMSLSEKYENTENKPVFGDSVTADVSRSTVEELEARNPELKRYANEIYSVNNYLRNLLVEGGVISQETADLWAEMYPHYVPIRRAGEHGLNINVPLDTGRTGVNAPVKRATGGSTDILPLFGTMAQRALQTYKTVAKNRFGVELKNTLGTTIATETADVDSVIDGVDQNEELLQKGKNGRKPTFTVFEGGEKVTFEITDTMYDALKPTSEVLTYTNKFANTVSNLHRGVLTEYNPSFLARNIIKDTQDVLINSQHPAKTYANFPKAIKEMTTKGKWYTEYVKNGGEQNTYFDKKENTFSKEEKSKFIKVVGMPLNVISTANNYIERLPRLAEYITSREEGRSIEVSMLDSARVTTNFAAGGDFTKFLNRNGATFLNASVQGLMQNVRNVREARMNGLKGWVQLTGKCAVASIPAIMLNSLLWDDDEEYEELSDYVKQNYYVVAKYGDGKFVRIPKGRTLSVIQDALEQTINFATGNDEVDLESFVQLVITNLAPNDPLEDNIISPIKQAVTNKSWYGEELVPTRLQDLPSEEQYDETTDSLSVWLGDKTGLSPYKINYVLDQYSGALGDSLLPLITPAAESEKDTAIGEMFAPIRDAFTTDSVLKNQNVSDFYDKKEELVTNAKRRGATDADILSNKYFNSVNTEIGKLYAEKREIQSGDYTDSEKYYLVKEIQKKINKLSKEALKEHTNVNIDGSYAIVGDRHYRKTDEGWEKISEEQLEKQNEVISGTGIKPGQYWDFKYGISRMTKIAEKVDYVANLDLTTEQKNALINGETDRKEPIDLTGYENYGSYEEFELAKESPKKYSASRVIGYDEYTSYMDVIEDIRADKDSNGKTINGSAKKKKTEYINSLDLDYGQRIILYRSLFDSKADKNTYNPQIVEYLDSREDITSEEMKAILESLDMKVHSDGRITW